MKKRLIIATVALLLQIIQYLKNRAKLLAKNNLFNIARGLQQLSPTQLIKNFSKLQNYGICFGKAFSSEKCKSILLPSKSVLISKLYQRKKVYVKGQLQSFRKIIRVKRPSFFTLNDGFSSIPVLQAASLTMKTPFMTQKYNINKDSQINFILSLINLFRNYRIPYITDSYFEQKYLPEETPIAVLGKFKKQTSGVITCEKPIAMGLSKQQILQRLRKMITSLKIQKYLLILGISCCLGYISVELYNIYKKQMRKRSDPIQNYQKITVKSRVCVNCKQKLSNFIFESCGHLTMCKQCKQKVNICPQCKKKVNQGFQLYDC